MKRVVKGRASREFDKYDYYFRSVQGPETDVEFIRDTYKQLRGKLPRTLREDFCGTYAISCEWAKLDKRFDAIGVDLDPEPIAYGTAHYWAKLPAGTRERVKVLQADVRDPQLPKADAIAAMNFSHYIFKERAALLAYFRNCRQTLRPGGILLADCFGGSRCQEENEEETVHRNFSYFWDQVSFDPITNHALFYIHFKPKGQKKIERVFEYDWRMWSIPELREIMAEAGFAKTYVYWEGTTKKGKGDGVFKQAEIGEECEAWIAYVVGLS
jgi:SAM-dependent methyltransferase